MHTARRSYRKKGTRKRGGVIPPSNIPPPPYNSSPPPYHTIHNSASNRRRTVNSSQPSVASSSNLPPGFNEPITILPIYTPNSQNVGTHTNTPKSHNMATGTNTPESAVMQTQTNRVSVSNMETQTNNNNGRNIPTMTEDELLQQYTSVYEKMTSKADAAESAALLKPHLKSIRNPVAIYMVGHMYINNDGYSIYRSSTLHTYFITRNNVHFVNSTYNEYPKKSSYPSSLFDMTLDIATARGYTNGKNINRLTYHIDHQFKKPLDSRLIHMFQTISKIPDIGQTTTGWMPDLFRYPTIPIGNPINNRLFMAVCRAL
jgi:hypothetical protein